MTIEQFRALNELQDNLLDLIDDLGENDECEEDNEIIEALSDINSKLAHAMRTVRGYR